jgi:hypothetical protein
MIVSLLYSYYFSYFFVLTERDNFGTPELITNGIDDKDSSGIVFLFFLVPE